MKKLMTAVLIGSMMTASSFIFAAGNPCTAIAQACMKLGYVKNGAEGKRLVIDCVQPVVNGQKTLEGTQFSAEEMAQCKTTIETRMQ